MKTTAKTLVLIIMVLVSLNVIAQKGNIFIPKVVYKTDNLVVTQITAHSYQHTSFLQTDDFGNVPCNGLIVSDHNEVVIFDTPTNDKSAEELISWIKETLHAKINAIIPTHFHNDCLGGLQAFHNNQIPSYAYFRTIELAKENKFAVPQNSFTKKLILKVGNEKVMANFFGEGHTKDNIVGYFPKEHILFGGCLIKELEASKGYLGDANVATWSATVEKIKKAYPLVKIIIPGHGAYGNKALLDYTIQLFKIL